MESKIKVGNYRPLPEGSHARARRRQCLRDARYSAFGSASQNARASPAVGLAPGPGQSAGEKETVNRDAGPSNTDLIHHRLAPG